METEAKKGLQVRIFIGTPLNAHLEHNLKENPRWKESQLGLANLHQTHLREVFYNGERFIGRYLQKKALTVKELQAIHEEVIHSLFELCPNMESQHLRLKLFPQIFIS